MGYVIITYIISNVEHKSRRTALMPVTIMEEVPVLTIEERAESSRPGESNLIPKSLKVK
jgi:hypothetical protein